MSDQLNSLMKALQPSPHPETQDGIGFTGDDGRFHLIVSGRDVYLKEHGGFSDRLEFVEPS